MSYVRDTISGAGDWVEGKLLGGDAADAASEASKTQAAAQMAGLDYLKETEAIPQAFRQAGLQQLGALAGFTFDPETGEAAYTGDTGAQQGLLDAAQASPFYQTMADQAQEATLRSRGATGGLRSGGAISDVASVQNKMLMDAYNQQLSGIQGLAMMPSEAKAISQGMSNVGQTQAMGQLGAAQAQQQAFGNLLGLGGQLGAAALSDVRLKENIKYKLPTAHPEIHFYTWDWLPESGKEGAESGYLAQEVQEIYPSLVVEGEDGYLRINRDELERKLENLEVE